MAAKLNSMRLLEKHDIPYEVIEYRDSMRDAEAIAEVLEVAPHLVYKTLVVEPTSGGKPSLALIASHRSLDLKKMAAVMGVKKAVMTTHRDAERLTGLKVGGISALALTHKNWAVYLDKPAIELEHILMSAGQRGMDLRVPTALFIRVVQAKVVEISTDSNQGGS